MFNTPNYNYSYPWASYGTAQTQSQQSQINNGIIWVQGESGAKSYLIAGPNQSVLLMDSENDVFYIKSSDASGMPMPLRIFDYTERITTTKNGTTSTPTTDYITRKEFEKRLAEITNAKQHLSTTKQQQQQ